MTLDEIDAMTDEDVEALFYCARWPPDGAPKCPSCQSREFYALDSRRTRKCRACGKQYSLLSGTALSHSKVPLRRLLMSMVLFCDGVPAREAGRIVGGNDKAAWVLNRKFAALGARDPRGMLHEAMQSPSTPELRGYWQKHLNGGRPR